MNWRPLIRRRWMQISVRTLLLVVFALCVALGVMTNRARRQQALVKDLIRRGGKVVYVHEVDSAGKPIPDATLPGPDWLRTLVGDHPYLRLQSVASGQLSDDDLKRLAEFDTLQILQYGEQITDAGLAHLAGMPNLKVIDGDSPKITDRGLRNLAGLTKLELLSLENAQVSDEGLKSLEALPSLKYLNLGWTQATADGVARLRQRLPQLKIDPPTFPSAEAERDIVRQLIQAGARFRSDKEGWIKDVHFIGPEVADEQLLIMLPLERVQTLFLLNTRVTSAGIERVLAAHPALKANPQFKTPHPDDADAVAALRRYGAKLYFDDEGHVRDVQMFAETVEDADLAALRGLPRLTGLGVHSPRITDAGLRHIAPCKELETLYLYRGTFSDNGLQHLQGLAKLRHLDVEGAALTDESTKALVNLNRLTHLSLRHTSMKGPGLAHLAALADLEQLLLGDSPIDDAGLASLPNLPKLKRLNLASTAITDEGLRQLPQLESLEVLTLTNTDVSDSGLRHLQGLPALKSLRVEHTRVSKQGQDQFRELKPKCKVTR